MAGDDGGGQRSLQGEQRAIVVGDDRDALRQAFADIGVVDFLAGGVDDEHQAAVVAGGDRARHHEVVDDAAEAVIRSV